MDCRVDPGNDAFLYKYNPDQPRVPARNSDGGQWTSDDRSGLSSVATDSSGSNELSRPVRYAALEIGTQSDVSDDNSRGSSANNSSNNDREIAAGDGPVKPGGLIFEHVPAPDPLDPQRLNGPISLEEQQRVADAINLYRAGDASTLNRHPYKNLPHDITGAVLPPSAGGYTTYNVVPGPGPGRGVSRILVDNTTGAIYYTNNHYFSFYPIQLPGRRE